MTTRKSTALSKPSPKILRAVQTDEIVTHFWRPVSSTIERFLAKQLKNPIFKDYPKSEGTLLLRRMEKNVKLMNDEVHGIFRATEKARSRKAA